MSKKFTLKNLVDLEVYRNLKADNAKGENSIVKKQDFDRANNTSTDAALQVDRKSFETDELLFQRRLKEKIGSFAKELPEKDIGEKIRSSTIWGGFVVLALLITVFSYLIFQKGALLKVNSGELDVGGFLFMASLHFFLLVWMFFSLVRFLLSLFWRTNRNFENPETANKDRDLGIKDWFLHVAGCVVTFPVKVAVTAVFLVGILPSPWGKPSRLVRRKLRQFALDVWIPGSTRFQSLIRLVSLTLAVTSCLVWAFYGAGTLVHSRIQAESLAPPRVLAHGNILRPNETNFSESIGKIFSLPPKLTVGEHDQSEKNKDQLSLENTFQWRDYIWKVTGYSITIPRSLLFLFGLVLLLWEFKSLRPGLTPEEYSKLRSELIKNTSVTAGEPKETDYTENASDPALGPLALPQPLEKRHDAPCMFVVAFQHRPNDLEWEQLSQLATHEVARINYLRDPDLETLSARMKLTESDALQESTLLILTSVFDTPNRAFTDACQKLTRICNDYQISKRKVLVSQSNRMLKDGADSSTTRFENWRQKAQENGFDDQNFRIADTSEKLTLEAQASLADFLEGSGATVKKIVVANKLKPAFLLLKSQLNGIVDHSEHPAMVLENITPDLDKLYADESKVLGIRIDSHLSDFKSKHGETIKNTVGSGVEKAVEASKQLAALQPSLWNNVPNSVKASVTLGLVGLTGGAAATGVLTAYAVPILCGSGLASLPFLGDAATKLFKRIAAQNEDDEPQAIESIALDDVFRLVMFRIILLEFQGNDASLIGQEMEQALSLLEFKPVSNVAEALEVLNEGETVLTRHWQHYVSPGDNQ